MDKDELAAATAAAEVERRETEGGLDDDDDLNENGNGSGQVDELKSLIDQVADLRTEAKKDHHLDLPIPGTKQLLWARFRPFPSAKTERKSAGYRKAVERGGAIMLNAACDTIIDATDQVMLLKPEYEGDIGLDGDNLIPIDDSIPVGWDMRLADLFIRDHVERAQIKKARQVVIAMFPTEQAIIQMNVTVSQWLNDVTRQTDQDFLSD